MKKWFFLLSMSGLAAATSAQSKLDGDWILSYIQMNSGMPEFNPFFIRNGVEIRFQDNGDIGVFEGHDMCNRAGGKFVFKDGKLEISDLGVTEKACSMNWPPNVWGMLQQNSSYLVVGDNLYIRFDNDKNLMAFDRKEP